MATFETGSFVRVLARDQNNGRLGVVVEPRAGDVMPERWHVWVEMAHPVPFSGVYRALYHVNELRVAEGPDRQE